MPGWQKALIYAVLIGAALALAVWLIGMSAGRDAANSVPSAPANARIVQPPAHNSAPVAPAVNSGSTQREHERDGSDGHGDR